MKIFGPSNISKPKMKHKLCDFCTLPIESYYPLKCGCKKYHKECVDNLPNGLCIMCGEEIFHTVEQKPIPNEIKEKLIGMCFGIIIFLFLFVVLILV